MCKTASQREAALSHRALRSGLCDDPEGWVGLGRRLGTEARDGGDIRVLKAERPLDCKEIQPVHSEGEQPRVFFGGNDAKAETPVLWPRHAKS